MVDPSLASSVPYTGASTFQSGLSGNIQESGIGTARADNLERLYGLVFGSAYNPSALSGIQLEAFQLAVWKLSQDDGFTLTSAAQGDARPFYVTSTSDAQGTLSASSSGSTPGTAVTIAQQWLTAVQQTPNGASMPLQALNNATVQDFLIPEEGSFTQIPEPSEWALIAGLTTMAAMLCRRGPGGVGSVWGA